MEAVTTNPMENKKTTELLDLLANLTAEDYREGGTYQAIMGELETREPFVEILSKDWDTSLPSAWEAIDELKEEIKKLKRHKHDTNGDVLIRI